MYVAAAAVASAATSALAVIALPEMSRILSRGVPALAPWYTHNNCVDDNAANAVPLPPVPLSIVATLPGVMLLPEISST